jgi:phytoene/squalene synthetase
MSLEACRDLVEAADRDRFDVTVLAPENVQKILWPLYAFNIEVSRAPWVTQEPMIAEIRLQWWRDALAEIREGKQVRSHAVTVPLADILDAEGAMVLDKLVEARSWDIYGDPFPNRESFDAYIDATYGNLIWTAARLIAPETEEKPIRKFAYGCGVAAILRATARLRKLGRSPLFEDNVTAFHKLAKHGFFNMNYAIHARKSLPKSLEPLLLSGWNAFPTFITVRHNAQEVYENGFTQSEFSRRWRIFKLSWRGWWH